MWRSRLRARARKMLDVLVASYSMAVDRLKLAEATSITASGGTFQTYLSDLRRNGRADVDGSEIRASESLFIG